MNFQRMPSRSYSSCSSLNTYLLNCCWSACEFSLTRSDRSVFGGQHEQESFDSDLMRSPRSCN